MARSTKCTPLEVERFVMAANLRQRTKAQVFEIYCRECLGRVHNAKASELRKDWMIEDILVTRLGQ